MSKRQKRKVVLFHQQDGKCHWCKVPLDMTTKNGGTLQDNAATVDHLRDRSDALRWESNKERTQRTVLACFRCNNNRGRESNKNLQNAARVLSTGKSFNNIETIIAGCSQILEGLCNICSLGFYRPKIHLKVVTYLIRRRYQK